MKAKLPYISEIAPDTFAINEFGLSAMYLLLGEQRGLLIDTGCGLFDLKKTISDITDKSYDVVLTHGHLDHVGGAGVFDHVYINKADKKMAENLDYRELRKYADNTGKMGSYGSYDFSIETIRKINKMPEFSYIDDDDFFDLGNRNIVVISVPGHTKGSIVLLDEKNRIMFSGDSCNSNLLIMGGSVHTTRDGLLKLKKKVEEKADQNFSGHLGYAGRQECFSQPYDTLNELIYLCNTALDHHKDIKVVSEQMDNVHNRLKYGTSMITYDRSKV